MARAPFLSSMIAIFSALIPVFLLIVGGWLISTLNDYEEPFWSATESLVFWLFLPALLLTTTANATLEGFRILPLATALLSAILVTAGAAMLVRRWLRIDDAGFSSVFQGAIRTNVYVGLAAASAIYGAAGLAVMGIVVFVVITAVNVLSVLALAHYGRRSSEPGIVMLALVGNPLIIACLIGFSLNALGLPPSGFIGATLDILARAALPLGLLCVGAGLQVQELRHHPRAMLAAGALKLLFMPFATAVFCWMLGIEGVTAAAAVLFNTVPISASTYVLARHLGGDAPLAAGMITVTTLAAVVTMPLMLTLLT